MRCASNARIAELAQMRARAWEVYEETRSIRYARRRMLEATRAELSVARKLTTEIQRLMPQWRCRGDR